MTHTIVVGLGFGDEGKGTIVDYLCASRDIKLVVRASGGPQNAHNVVLPDGRHHTFSQFGSGTLRGVPTFVSRFVAVNPLNMAREARHLHELTDRNPFASTHIDPRCLLITPFHRAVNRVREQRRGDARHGSCGQGVGEARLYEIEHQDAAPTMYDMNLGGADGRRRLENKLKLYVERHSDMLDEYEEDDLPTIDELLDSYQRMWLDGLINLAFPGTLRSFLRSGDVVFEGSQGVLLDEWHGFHPYTTWSTTTFENAETLLTEAGVERDQWTRLGVTRTYTTRHGAGPFPTEDASLLERYPEEHNTWGKYQGGWRVGRFDGNLLSYAVDMCGGIDQLAVTHMDRLGEQVSCGYEEGDYFWMVGHDREDLAAQERWTRLIESATPSLITRNTAGTFLGFVHMMARARVSIVSSGPTSDDKIELGPTAPAYYERALSPS